MQGPCGKYSSPTTLRGIPTRRRKVRAAPRASQRRRMRPGSTAMTSMARSATTANTTMAYSAYTDLAMKRIYSVSVTVGSFRAARCPWALLQLWEGFV